MDLNKFFQLNYKEAKRAFEIRYLCHALVQHDNNITHTASAIGLHRQSLQQKIKLLELHRYQG